MCIRDSWEVWEQVTTDYHPLTIFYKGTADDGSTSISVAENDTVVTQLKPELLQVILDGLKEQAPYMVIKESEMRSMEGTPVFYLEMCIRDRFHGILRSFRIRQLVGEVGAGGRGGTRAVGVVFSVVEAVSYTHLELQCDRRTWRSVKAHPQWYLCGNR